MDVEVDDVVVAAAVLLLHLFEVAGEGLVGAGAQDVDLDPQLRLAQGVEQRAGDGAVADVTGAAGAGGDEQDVDGGRLAQARLDGLRGEVAADEADLERQRLAFELGVAQGFPVIALEGGRAGDLDGEVGEAALRGSAIGGVGVAVGKDGGEEPLAVGAHAGGGIVGLDLVGEGEVEIALEVPLELLLFFGREGIFERERILLAIDADDGVRAGDAAFADADDGAGHGWGLLGQAAARVVWAGD